MRVALVPSAYEPSIGGVEQLTRRLAAQLVAVGDEVEVWTTQHPADLPAEAIVDGLVVRRFPFYLPPARPVALMAFPWRATSVLRRMRAAAAAFRPDVIHVQCFGANGAYALALAETAGVPLVVSLQGETVMDDHDIYDRSASLRFMLRLAMRRAHAVTACSRFTLDDASRRFGSPRGRSEVVFNGVDLDDEAPAPAPLEGISPGFVLALGRLVHKKGFDLLLQAFAHLPDACGDARLVVAGGGPELPALRALAARLGLSARVQFPGYLHRGQVAWAMENASMFVLPSRVEPFGIVVLEAMRAGRPVVVSNRGGAPEIIQSSDQGLAIDPFDAEAFAAVLADLLQDGLRRARIGENGRVRAAAFAWSTIAGRYRDIYESAVTGPLRRKGSRVVG